MSELTNEELEATAPAPGMKYSRADPKRRPARTSAAARAERSRARLACSAAASLYGNVRAVRLKFIYTDFNRLILRSKVSALHFSSIKYGHFEQIDLPFS